MMGTEDAMQVDSPKVHKSAVCDTHSYPPNQSTVLVMHSACDARWPIAVLLASQVITQWEMITEQKRIL